MADCRAGCLLSKGPASRMISKSLPRVQSIPNDFLKTKAGGLLNPPGIVRQLYLSTDRSYCFASNFKSGFSRIAPCFAGIRAPLGGVFFDLKSSQICSIVTHSTPSLVLMYSIILQRPSVRPNEHFADKLTVQALAVHEDVRTHRDGRSLGSCSSSEVVVNSTFASAYTKKSSSR